MAPTNLPSKPPPKPQPKALQRFKFFPQLPTEIRIMIWKLCLPGPRVVDVRMRRKSIPTNTGEILDVGRFVSSVEHPVLLHVCAESRTLARKYYKLAFSKKTRTEWSPAQIYIDFSIDTVWFDNLRYFPRARHNNPRLIPRAEFARIRHLVMRHHVDYVLVDKGRLTDPKFFPALENIYTIITPMQPHPIEVRVNNAYTSNRLTRLWRGEKSCPVVHNSCAIEILEEPSELL